MRPTTPIGFSVFAISKRNQDVMDPLSFGVLDQPSPDILLRRKVVHVFTTKKRAEREIKRAYEAGRGMPWTKDWSLAIVPVFADVGRAKE